MHSIRPLMALALVLVNLSAFPAITLAEPPEEARKDNSAAPKIYDEPKRPLVPSPKIISDKQEQALSRDKCLMARPAFGDLGANWSVGLATSIQAVKYTFGTKQASSAASAGAGVAFRYYGKSDLGTKEAAKDLGFTDADLKAIEALDKGTYYDRESGMYSLPINKVSTACRATTSDIGKDRTDKLASSLVSLTPTVFYVKQSNESEISLQPAILLGFFDDIISIGPGFNLTGAEKGKVFLVLSLGYGFKF